MRDQGAGLAGWRRWEWIARARFAAAPGGELSALNGQAEAGK